MRSSDSRRAQIGTLIIATSGIQFANGFFTTLISLRVALEDFEATMAGLVLSGYFLGFTLGALRCERIIERVGHIRAYAAFAGLVVAATAAMPLLVEPLPWLVLRALVSSGCAGAAISLVKLPEELLVILPVVALLGGFMSTLYPVCVAHAHDRMPADRVVAVSSWLILISGLGSVLGPFIGMSLCGGST